MTLTYRRVKGSQLTSAEADANVDHLLLSSNLSFTQSGIGAVSENLQSRGRWVVYATDYMTDAQRTDVRNNVGAVDVTAAVQAALTYAQSINARCEFPPGTYLLSSALTCGSSTGSFALEITGLRHWTSTNPPLSGVYLNQSSASANTFSIRTSTSFSQSLVLHGLNIVHPAGSTGVAVDAIDGATAIKLDNVAIRNAGVGYYMRLGATAPIMRDVLFYGCATGWRIGGGASNPVTAAKLDNVIFQSGTGNAVLIDASTTATAVFSNCVFESNTGPDFLLNGHLDRATFDTCWFEAPGSDMIRLVSGNLQGIVFTNTYFDGTNGVGGRHVINNTAGAASSVYGRDITFLGCTIANLNGGRFLSIATDPVNSNDPGYANITIINPQFSAAVDLKGIHTATSWPQQMSYIHSKVLTEANILQNSSYLVKPKYAFFGPGAANQATFSLNGQMVLGGCAVSKRTAPTYGASIAIDATLGNSYVVTVTDGAAHAFAAPATPTTGQRIKLTARNTFGAIATATFNAVFKTAGYAAPANGFSTSADFEYDGTNWVQVSSWVTGIPN